MTFPSPDAPSPPAAPRGVTPTVGLLAAASCVGAVLGFGVRAGTPARAFNVIAAVTIGDAARGVWGWDSSVTPIGIAVLAVVMFGWGALYAALARHAHGWRALAWAAGVTAASWVLSATAVARVLGGEAMRVISPGQLAGLHLVLAVTLVAGMRFALGARNGDR